MMVMECWAWIWGYTAHQKRSLSMVKGLSVTAMLVILMIGSGSRKSYRCIKSTRGRMRLLSLLLGLILSWGVLATIDTYRFSSVEQEQQYRALTEQLRCPKCQNNSIADSNATIAADMRAKVYELMQQGYSKQQIVDYMVARYGNFVTYEPPVTAATIILWAGPLLFVLIGAAIVVLRARRRVEKEPPLSQQEQQRLQSLLAENSVLQNNALQNNKLQEESDRKKP
ncbi:cytochrome c-type biogenesis protein [Yersinia pestis Nepal516]|nr:cytochrome c-type biogenesis protein [Yersinia pestis Nepal516]